MSGNRCGHNPIQLRTCDIVRRGRGGHPQLLGILSAYLVHAAGDRRLRALDALNRSGRRKRTEQLEAVTAVAGFLVGKYFQPDTRRCVVPTADYLVAPDARHMAREISMTAEWKAHGISLDRIYAALDNLERAGYITRGKQTREQLATGEWVARPKILAFTKKFFLHLGGARLWQSVRQKGKALIGRVREALQAAPGFTLQSILAPGLVLSPRQAHQRHADGEPPPPSLLTRLREAANLARSHNKLYRV